MRNAQSPHFSCCRIFDFSSPGITIEVKLFLVAITKRTPIHVSSSLISTYQYNLFLRSVNLLPLATHFVLMHLLLCLVHPHQIRVRLWNIYDDCRFVCARPSSDQNLSAFCSSIKWLRQLYWVDGACVGERISWREAILLELWKQIIGTCNK